MEHWEEFFVEKSRRRFDNEQRERRRQRAKAGIAAAFIAILIIGAVTGLALFG